MAKRRIISSDLNSDEHFNSLSLKAQIIFFRMLSISDDYGIVPMNEFKLCSLIVCPHELRKSLMDLVREILSAELGFAFEYGKKLWFAFKPESFSHWQSSLISRRVRSEYLRMEGTQAEELMLKASEGIGKASVSLLNGATVSDPNEAVQETTENQNPLPLFIPDQKQPEKPKSKHFGNGKHRFRESPFFPFDEFEKAIGEWSREECLYWHEAMMDASDADADMKYSDWSAVARVWRRREEKKARARQ